MKKSELFKNAWAIARKAQASFGGKVKEYFSASLSQAWKESKMEKNLVKFNITRKHAQALQESYLRTQAARADMSESRTVRAQEKLDAFLASKPADTVCFFLFGKTFSEKDALKAAGWKYDGNSKCWWSRENLEDFGFMKISA